MITKKVIDELYRKYRRRPDSIDSLDIPLLFEHAPDNHDLQIDADGNLIIGSIDERSPFREIALRNVNGITHFDDTLAIVLHSSILFLNKHDQGVNVHIRTEQPSIWERLRWEAPQCLTRLAHQYNPPLHAPHSTPASPPSPYIHLLHLHPPGRVTDDSPSGLIISSLIRA